MTDEPTPHTAPLPETHEPKVEALPEPVASQAAAAPEAAAPEIAAPPAVETPAVRRFATPIWLTVLLVLAVAAEPLLLAKYRPELIAPASAVSQPQTAPVDAQLVSRITGVEQQMAANTARLAKLEADLAAVMARPAGAAGIVDLAPIASRLAAVEAALAALPAPTKPDLSALESRITALEQRPAASSSDVTSRIDAATQDVAARIAALDGQVKQQLQQEAAQIALTAQLRAATLALEAGQKLGKIAGAPPELARFETVAPPREAALRLSFAHYAEAGAAASQPEGGDGISRAMQRLGSLVTIREGHDVLVGNTAATVIETARGRLEAGDLAGCVAELAALDSKAKAAMQPWLDQAQALLAARAALLAMAAKS